MTLPPGAPRHPSHALALVLTLGVATMFAAGLMPTLPGAQAGQSFGAVQVDGPHTAACPNGGADTIQQAVDCALPGATVYVSPGTYDPVTITTPDLTVCSHVGGPLCALDVETAHWQKGSGTSWQSAPGGAAGQAIRIEGSGSTSLFPAPGLRLTDVFALSFDTYLESGSCGAGTPRIAFGIDVDGDGARDGNVFAYPGADRCATNEWVHVDLMDDPDAYWASGTFGGPNHGTAADAQTAIEAAAAANGATPRIAAINLQADSGAPTLYIDNQRVNNWLFAEQEEELCFFDPTGASCRHKSARRDTVIRTDSGNAVTILADGITLRGFSIRAGGISAPNGVFVGTTSGPSHADVRILDNHLETPGLAESGITGRFDDGLIEGNHVQGFRQGVYLRTHGKSVTVTNNSLIQNGEGILTYGFSPRIDGNTISDSVVRAIGIGNVTSLPAGNVPILRNNTISGQTPALGFRDTVSRMHVDGRYNDWGAYGRDDIEASFQGLENDNTVDTRCYRNAADTGYACPPTAAGFTTHTATDHWRRAAFFADASTPGTTEIVRRTWDFGDGASGTGASVSHIYGSSGQFLVTYTITDSDGYTATATSTVTRTNAAPVLDPIDEIEAVPGQRIEFIVNGADPDHDRVTITAATLPVGATFAGQAKARTFAWIPTTAQTGLHTVAFTASDGDKQTTRTVTLNVTMPAAQHGVSLERTALWAQKGSPGQQLTLPFVVRNDGGTTDTFSFASTGPAGWNMTVPAPVTLGPGETAQVVATVTVPDDAGAGTPGLTVASDAAGWASHSATYLVRVPVQLHLTIDEVPTLAGTVTGTVRATFLDGSPVKDHKVTVRHTPPSLSLALGSTQDGLTGADGTFAYTFRGPAAGLPGTHELGASLTRHGQSATDRATYAPGV